MRLRSIIWLLVLLNFGFFVYRVQGQTPPSSFPININPGAYIGQYAVDTIAPPLITGPTTVNLTPGDHILFINPISTAFTVSTSGQVVSTSNPTALSFSNNTISFNTVSVVIDPGNYDGIYNLSSIPGPLATNFTGRQSFALVAGIRLFLQVGGNDHTGITCSVDANGQLSSLNNPTAASINGNVLTFNNVTISVNPVAYAGWYFPSIYLFRAFFGAHNLIVVPGVDIGIDNGLLDTNSTFLIRTDSAGQITVENNSPAATASGNTLTFNNAPIVIDQGQYQGVMVVSDNQTGFFGGRTLILIPGLDYGFDNGFGLGFGVIFTLDGNGNISRVNLPAPLAFNANNLHVQTVPIVIDPGVYDGPLALTPFEGFAGFRGKQVFQFIPQMHYGVDGADFTGPLANGFGFSFDIDQNGLITNISNPAAAQSSGSTLLLSCAGVHIDPTTYAGAYRVGEVFSLSGPRDLNLINSLTKVLFGSDQGTPIGAFTPKNGAIVPASLATTVNGQAYNFQFAPQACMSPNQPAVTLSPSSLNFGPQTLGATSTAQNVTLTNTGTGLLNINNVALSGDFKQASSTCSNSLAAGASCSIGVTFTPTALGSRTGGLSIFDDAAGSPQTVSLTGAGSSNICVAYDQTRSVHSGAAYPVKIELCDGAGNDLSSPAITVHATQVTSVSGFAGLVDDAGNANPDNDFRFDSGLGPTGGYIFNLKTTGLASGTYSLQFTAGADPVTHSVNFGVK